jgi:hypothetical protein
MSALRTLTTSFAEAFPMSNENSNTKEPENTRTVYNQLCTSYHAIDDFRAKLLGLLPTGTGIFLVIPELLKTGRSNEGGSSQSGIIQTLSLPSKEGCSATSS